jgi:hypothetical protein
VGTIGPLRVRLGDGGEEDKDDDCGDGDLIRNSTLIQMLCNLHFAGMQGSILLCSE